MKTQQLQPKLIHLSCRDPKPWKKAPFSKRDTGYLGEHLLQLTASVSIAPFSILFAIVVHQKGC